MEGTVVATYVVIGGGIAGVTCAEHLHILDPEASVILLTASPLIKAVTNVLALTKTLDMFDVEEKPSTELELQCPNVKVFMEIASEIKAKDKLVYTKSGRSFAYEKLCICSGASPKPIAEDNPYVLWIRDTESVVHFQEKLGKARRIMIVGNGGIATEMVHEIKDVEVVWAVKDKSITATFIDAGAAEFLMPELFKEKEEVSRPVKRKKYTVDDPQVKRTLTGGALGPDWHTTIELKGETTRRIILEREVEVKNVFTPSEAKEREYYVDLEPEKNWPVYVELSNGRFYGCDFIVSATGVTPNVSQFLSGNDFRIGEDGGLLVSDTMETSEKDVYAAGDVCTPGWDTAKHWFQMRLWTQARQMGSYAAKMMWSSSCGEEMYMDFCFEMFCHATKFFGYKVILLGLCNGQKLDKNYEILLRVTKGHEFVKCIMQDGRMQGAVLIGETDLEETFENLILNQMDLSIYGEDLLNPDIDIEDYFD